jgi:aspartyl/asparaginyl beta-hydroxylase (cupin superfamily)
LLSPGTKLTPHRGWGFHSNHVIRCHYGIIIPKNKCLIYVKEDVTNENKIKFHSQFEWLIFDDSKTHYAENFRNTDRIILILDIARPDDIEPGNAVDGNTNELAEIVKYFKNKKIFKINE